MGILKTLAITVVIIFVLAYGALTMLGMTSLSRPKDLGVKYTEQDYQSMRSKFNYQVVEAAGSDAAENGLSYSDPMPVKASFSSEEVTARLNDNSWKYSAAKDTQVRINTDGSVEMSGRLLKSNLDENMERFDMGLPEDIMKRIDSIPLDPVFYVKGKGEIKDNQITLDLDEAKVGSFDVPVDSVPKAQLENMFEEAMGSVDGLDIKSMSISDGKLDVDGTAPSKIIVSE